MKSGSPARVAALAVGVVVIALIAVLAVGIGRSDQSIVGEPAPRFAGETIDGNVYDIADAEGKWVIVNFFATWCPGCINEHDDLIELAEWADDSGQAEVVAIVFNDSPEQVEAFFLNQGGDWPVLIDPTVADRFGVTNIPETFVVNPSGNVALHIEGEVDAEQLIALLEEPAP